MSESVERLADAINQLNANLLAASDTLCLFRLADGSIFCAPCDHPPNNSTYLSVAPEGTEEGPVGDNERNREAPNE